MRLCSRRSSSAHRYGLFLRLQVSPCVSDTQKGADSSVSMYGGRHEPIGSRERELVLDISQENGPALCPRTWVAILHRPDNHWDLHSHLDLHASALQEPCPL
jgi:hypothetical protein